MRTTDIIRQILDIIDQVDGQHDIKEPEEIHADPDSGDSRFRQILAMLQNDESGGFENTPNEIVSNIDSVTTDAGGGVNGPKHPADIRVKDPGYGHGS